MRRLLALAVLLAGLAPAVVSAGPPLCASACEVVATSAGYVPPVQVVQSGATVTWTAVDAAHPTSNSLTSNGRCFLLPIGMGTSGAVRFRIVGGELRATTSPGTGQAETQTCPGATALPTGDMLLRYQCVIHPQMHAALLIQP